MPPPGNAPSPESDPATRPAASYRRHRFLDYQGYSFPWYVTVMWISFLVIGMLYLARFILFT